MTTVMLRPCRWCAACSVVVPMSIITVAPSATSAAAAAPIRSLAAKRSTAVSSNGGSPAACTAPPRTRSSLPFSASSRRSRRTVISDTPKLAARSLTCVEPDCTARSIAWRRCAGSRGRGSVNGALPAAGRAPAPRRRASRTRRARTRRRRSRSYAAAPIGIVTRVRPASSSAVSSPWTRPLMSGDHGGTVPSVSAQASARSPAADRPAASSSSPRRGCSPSPPPTGRTAPGQARSRGP